MCSYAHRFQVRYCCQMNLETNARKKLGFRSTVDRKLVAAFTFLPALGRWFRFPLFCYVTGKEARKQEARSKLTRYTLMCTATTAEPCTLSLLQSQQEACQWSNWEKGTYQSPDVAFLEPPIQSSFYKRENLRTRMENWLVPSSTLD